MNEYINIVIFPIEHFLLEIVHKCRYVLKLTTQNEIT